ncbi:MAG: hypothetical protein ACOC53_07285 [Candidatus Saliniplasma sp.]
MKKRVINTVSEDNIKVPPGWITKLYLTLEPPRKFKRNEVVKDIDDKNRIDQFLRQSPGYGLLKKLNRGEYFAVDPCIAVNCWAIGSYYAELLLLDSLFEYIGMDHAFLCLSANEYGDYVPERPMLVTKERIGFKELDNFVYDFRTDGELTVKVMKKTFELPLLNREETALLLMSTYLSREVKAGKEMIRDIDLNKKVKSKLSNLGYPGFDGDASIQTEIQVPDWIRDKQEKVGIGRLKEIATR